MEDNTVTKAQSIDVTGYQSDVQVTGGLQVAAVPALIFRGPVFITASIILLIHILMGPISQQQLLARCECGRWIQINRMRLFIRSC